MGVVWTGLLGSFRLLCTRNCSTTHIGCCDHSGFWIVAVGTARIVNEPGLVQSTICSVFDAKGACGAV
jgi:hypothetical protein